MTGGGVLVRMKSKMLWLAMILYFGFPSFCAAGNSTYGASGYTSYSGVEDANGDAFTVIQGSQDYGRLILGLGDEVWFPVVNNGSSGTYDVTMSRDTIGSGSGNVALFYRLSDSSFNQDAEYPLWKLYTGEEERTYQYRQIMVRGGDSVLTSNFLYNSANYLLGYNGVDSAPLAGQAFHGWASNSTVYYNGKTYIGMLGFDQGLGAFGLYMSVFDHATEEYTYPKYCTNSATGQDTHHWFSIDVFTSGTYQGHIIAAGGNHTVGQSKFAMTTSAEDISSWRASWSCFAPFTQIMTYTKIHQFGNNVYVIARSIEADDLSYGSIWNTTQARLAYDSIDFDSGSTEPTADYWLVGNSSGAKGQIKAWSDDDAWGGGTATGSFHLLASSISGTFVDDETLDLDYTNDGTADAVNIATVDFTNTGAIRLMGDWDGPVNLFSAPGGGVFPDRVYMGKSCIDSNGDIHMIATIREGATNNPSDFHNVAYMRYEPDTGKGYKADGTEISLPSDYEVGNMDYIVTGTKYIAGGITVHESEGTITPIVTFVYETSTDYFLNCNMKYAYWDGDSWEVDNVDANTDWRGHGQPSVASDGTVYIYAIRAGTTLYEISSDDFVDFDGSEDFTFTDITPSSMVDTDEGPFQITCAVSHLNGDQQSICFSDSRYAVHMFRNPSIVGGDNIAWEVPSLSSYDYNISGIGGGRLFFNTVGADEAYYVAIPLEINLSQGSYIIDFDLYVDYADTGSSVYIGLFTSKNDAYTHYQDATDSDGVFIKLVGSTVTSNADLVSLDDTSATESTTDLTINDDTTYYLRLEVDESESAVLSSYSNASRLIVSNSTNAVDISSLGTMTYFIVSNYASNSAPNSDMSGFIQNLRIMKR